MASYYMRHVMAAGFRISVNLPVSPERLFTAWLDNKEHSAFTGSPAEIDRGLMDPLTLGMATLLGKL